MPIGTLKDVRPENKTVLLRLDLNSPIDPTTHHILDDKRFREHIPTIQALSGSRVVIVTHQSRPGKKDFTTLEGHAERLEGLLQRKVRYIDDIFGQCARGCCAEDENGDLLMLENVRFNAEENLTLNPDRGLENLHRQEALTDGGHLRERCFWDFAPFAAYHGRSSHGHAVRSRSPDGKEVATLSRVFENAPGPVCMVLGGTKVDDSLSVAEHVLPTRVADLIIVTGVVGNVFLLAAGFRIGGGSCQIIQQLGYEKEVKRARILLESYKDRILYPTSVAIKEEGRRVEYPAGSIPEDAMILDAGMDAISYLAEKIRSCRTVVFNGPAGVFEDADYATGTHELLRAASKAEFSIIGGGHTARGCREDGHRPGTSRT